MDGNGGTFSKNSNLTINKNNNFVGMQVCPYCNEPMGVLIHTHLREIPRVSCTGPEPCNACKAKFEKDDVVPVWEVSNRLQY